MLNFNEMNLTIVLRDAWMHEIKADRILISIVFDCGFVIKPLL